MKGEQDKGGLGQTVEPQQKLGGLTDEALLELVRAGDERAFETLVLRYRRPLRSYCVRLGIALDAADDVLQQVMLEAWLAMHRGAQVHSFKAWLFRVAHNVSLDTIAATPRVSELGAGEAELAASTQPEMLEPGVKETLTAVAELPLLQREAIVRTALAGESYEQVGHYLGLTASAVRGLIHRGRATLRGALAALVPPWLARLIATRSGAAGSARESLLGLAYGAGSSGSAGALVKAGVIAAAAAAAITTAIPGQATHPHSRHRQAATLPGRRSADGRAEVGGRSDASASAAAGAAANGGSRAGASRNRSHSLHALAFIPGSSAGSAGSAGTRAVVSGPQTSTAPPSQPGAVHQTSDATSVSLEPASSTASAGTGPGSSPSQTSGTPAAGESGSTASTGPAPGATGTAGSGSADQSSSPSGSSESSSSSSGSGGVVGELVHTVEKTLETTIESTLGGLLHH